MPPPSWLCRMRRVQYTGRGRLRPSTRTRRSAKPTAFRRRTLPFRSRWLFASIYHTALTFSAGSCDCLHRTAWRRASWKSSPAWGPVGPQSIAHALSSGTARSWRPKSCSYLGGIALPTLQAGQRANRASSCTSGTALRICLVGQISWLACHQIQA